MTSSINTTHCRTCFSGSKEQIPLSSTIREYFKNYLSFVMSTNSNLPNTICLSCYNDLIKFRQFYLQCRDVEEFYKLQIGLRDVHDDPEKTGEHIEFGQIRIEVEDETLEDVEVEGSIDIENEEYETEDNAVEVEDDIVDGLNSVPHDEFQEDKLVEELDISEIHYECGVELEEKLVSSSCEPDPSIEIELEDANSQEEHLEIDELEINSDYSGDIEPHLKCEECDITFVTVVEFKSHNQSVHGILSCKKCDKEFDNETDRNVHVQEAHKSNKKVSCGKCGKHFSSRYDLNIHSSIHTGEKPYECEVCHKRFRQKNTLKTHQTLHFGKNVKCEFCDKKFARKSQLILHNRMHRNERPFVCDECGVAFRQMQDLTNHKLTHSGVKTVQCNICFTWFFNRKGLNGHMNAVHPKNIFSCNICSQNYKKPLGLRKHLAKVHSEIVSDVSKYKISLDRSNENIIFEVFEDVDGDVNEIEESNYE